MLYCRGVTISFVKQNKSRHLSQPLKSKRQFILPPGLCLKGQGKNMQMAKLVICRKLAKLQHHGKYGKDKLPELKNPPTLLKSPIWKYLVSCVNNISFVHKKTTVCTLV